MKEFLVDGEILDRSKPNPWRALDDPVDERRGKPVAEAIEKAWNIEGHGVGGRGSRRRHFGVATGEPLKRAQSTRVPTATSTRRPQLRHTVARPAAYGVGGAASSARMTSSVTSRAGFAQAMPPSPTLRMNDSPLCAPT